MRRSHSNPRANLITYLVENGIKPQYFARMLRILIKKESKKPNKTALNEYNLAQAKLLLFYLLP